MGEYKIILREKCYLFWVWWWHCNCAIKCHSCFFFLSYSACLIWGVCADRYVHGECAFIHYTGIDPGITLFILTSFFFTYFLLLFKYCCLHFTPTTSPHPSHPHLPPLIPISLLGFVHVSFIDVPENPSPFSPHNPLPPPLWLLSVHS